MRRREDFAHGGGCGRPYILPSHVASSVHTPQLRSTNREKCACACLVVCHGAVRCGRVCVCLSMAMQACL